MVVGRAAVAAEPSSVVAEVRLSSPSLPRSLSKFVCRRRSSFAVAEVRLSLPKFVCRCPSSFIVAEVRLSLPSLPRSSPMGLELGVTLVTSVIIGGVELEIARLQFRDESLFFLYAIAKFR